MSEWGAPHPARLFLQGRPGRCSPLPSPKQVASGEDVKFQQTQENDRDNKEKQLPDGRVATLQRRKHSVSPNGKRKGGRGGGFQQGAEWGRS